MNEFDWIHIVWAFGALILMGGALAAYRLSWRKSLLYGLIWASIFTVATLLFNAFGV